MKIEPSQKAPRSGAGPHDLSEFSTFWASSGLLDKQPFYTRLATSDIPLMVLGETGSGKTRLARWLHAVSPRGNNVCSVWGCGTVHDQSFVAALFGFEKSAFTGADRTEIGLLRGCDGGTLILDDVNLLPLEDQARLLQFLDSGSVTPLGVPNRVHRVDVRVIVTSNEDPWALVKSGSFREDLYHRLAVMPIRLPSLSERTVNVVPLIRMYEDHWRQAFEDGAMDRTLSEGGIHLLNCFSWPGNYRGLRNLVLQLLLHGAESGKGPLHAKEVFRLMEDNGIGVEQIRQIRDDLDKDDRRYLDLLRATNWNTTLVARIGGVSRPTVYAKMEKHGWSREQDGLAPSGTKV